MVGHPTSRVLGDEIHYTQTMGEGERVVPFRICVWHCHCLGRIYQAYNKEMKFHRKNGE